MLKQNFIFVLPALINFSMIHSIISCHYRPFCNMSKKLISVDFEIFGRVQGVFFRKHTLQQAEALGLRGWCMNTEKGTVTGNIQGSPEAIANMKEWLKTTGSPSSRIDKSEFKNERELGDYTFKNFRIRR